MIGVHTPETQAEHKIESVRAKAREAEFNFPIVCDNEMRIWNAWGNSMWPSVYLVDKNGYIRYWWYGELNWKGAKGNEIMRSRIEELLAE